MSNQPDVRSLLNRAIEHIKKDENSQAQQILQGVIKADKRNVDAWYLVSFVVDTPEKRIRALENCLDNIRN